MRTLALIPTVALLSLIPFSLYASARSNSGGLAERVAELEAQVEALTAALQDAQEILQYVRVETEEMRGVTGPHLIIEGANFHLRSGSGTTRDACDPGDPGWPNCESLTGLGNLIIGYNEQTGVGQPYPREVRTGSHNIIVGRGHSYSSFGGFVAGSLNRIVGPNSSVAGGHFNTASGLSSTVCGGNQHEASGDASSVSGGQGREAPDELSWAAGNLFEPN
jgi:hypothetical protein